LKEFLVQLQQQFALDFTRGQFDLSTKVVRAITHCLAIGGSSFGFSQFEPAGPHK